MIAVVVTVVMVCSAPFLARVMHAPKEALEQTISYIVICSVGAIFIVAYNLVGSIFRGIGDSKIPLLTVAIACVLNIAGDLLAGIFAKDRQVVLAAADYLKAYALDCQLTSFLFCFIGYFNGCSRTTFVMQQGIIGAFAVRLPVSWFMSLQVEVTLFHIGLATPASSLVQIILCGCYFWIMMGRQKNKDAYNSAL
ncbi:MAG: MATE family efflux transporter [Lachnospiraceae bacterium]